MKTRLSIFITAVVASVAITQVFSCKVPESITSKTGAQLWAENCIRCHAAPSPADYSDDQWEVIGLHMQNRANLMPDEVEKIVAFLKEGNNP